MKYLIVGLGNPGDEYRETRHNVGFMVLDAWARVSSISFRTDRLGDTALLRLRGRQLHLLKPSTYMNLSGKAVAYWLQKLDLEASHLVVVVDDLALPLGQVRLRAKGSDGGHNGLKDIAARLGTQEYARLRLGIGHDFAPSQQVNYVLSRFQEEEAAPLKAMLGQAVQALETLCTQGVERAMNIANTRAK